MESREWLDGPSFVEFLEEHSIKPHWTNAALDRAYRRWRSGSAASVYPADSLLTEHNLTIHDIPDHCWIGPPQAHPLRDEAVIRFHNGESANALADELGVHAGTVRRWVRETRTNVRSLSDGCRTI